MKTTLGICGEPIIGRALTLLLRGSRYTVRFLLAQSLSEPEVLRDVRLSVLTPTPRLSIVRRDALVRSLKDACEVTNTPVLELVTPLEAGLEEAESESWHTVPWPCRIGELERQIEAAWMRHYETVPISSPPRTPLEVPWESRFPR